MDWFFFFSSRRRHTRCALVTGVQTCALPILARSDDGKPSGVEQSHVATAVEHCRRIFAKAHFQATRILGIGAADDPNGACLPVLDHLAQQESAPQQFLQAILVNHRMARTQDLSDVRREEIRRLTLDLAQMTRETFVFTGREQIRWLSASPGDEWCG